MVIMLREEGSLEPTVLEYIGTVNVKWPSLRGVNSMREWHYDGDGET